MKIVKFIGIHPNLQSSKYKGYELRLRNSLKILKRWKFGEKIWISLLNKKWVFLQNCLCSRKFSIRVNFDGRKVLSGHPCFVGWRPLTRSWFRFWFWWQFNGDFFERLVSLFFFAQFDSRFYFCVFWIFWSCFIIWTKVDRLGPTRTAQILSTAVDLVKPPFNISDKLMGQSLFK